MSGAVVVQTPRSIGVTRERLLALLAVPDLSRVRIAVAYAKWDGIGLISTALEALLKRGGSVETIFGAANGVTTADSLLYGLYLQELYGSKVYSGAVEDVYANSIFHPKSFEFRFKSHTVILVGSANLTGGGLLRNTEQGLEVKATNTSQLVSDLESSWKSLRSLASTITPKRVRELTAADRGGLEGDQNEGRDKNNAKPYLKTPYRLAAKPLFRKVLDLKKPAKKAKILSKLDALTTKPKTLYLQILEYETGGTAGNRGYQVQLPVATLGAYFGVGANEMKMAEFHFAGVPDPIHANLTHFENNTHRVRLKPILDIKRPAILKFVRTAPDVYAVSAIPKSKYGQALTSKCPEQTRKGARRWGLE